MNLQLNLMELNSLYVAVSNQLNVAKQEAKQYPSAFFDKQLVIAEELVNKIQTALYDEAADEAIYDEAVADIHNKISKYN